MGGGNPFDIDAETPTKRFTKSCSDGGTQRKRAIVDESDDEYFSVSSQPSRAGPSKRPRAMTDHGYDSLEDSDADEAASQACRDGYDSMDDEEENRRMGDLCAASLATENARLKVQVAQLEANAKKTIMQRDFWRNTADDDRQALRRAHRERVKGEQVVRQLRQKSDDQAYNVALLQVRLGIEHRKNHELTRRLQQSSCAAGIIGICKCLLSPSRSVHFDSAPDGTVYRRVQPPLGCHRYEVLNVRGKYDDGDAWWHCGPGVWTVAYHGTTLANVREIVRNGFHLSKAQRAVFGHGIYCTPDPGTAMAYATSFFQAGIKYRAVLQCFVDPNEKQLGKPANDAERADGEYWVLPGGHAIRPYAICLFEEP